MRASAYSKDVPSFATGDVFLLFVLAAVLCIAGLVHVASVHFAGAPVYDTDTYGSFGSVACASAYSKDVLSLATAFLLSVLAVGLLVHVASAHFAGAFAYDTDAWGSLDFVVCASACSKDVLSFGTDGVVLLFVRVGQCIAGQVHVASDHYAHDTDEACGSSGSDFVVCVSAYSKEVLSFEAGGVFLLFVPAVGLCIAGLVHVAAVHFAGVFAYDSVACGFFGSDHGFVACAFAFVTGIVGGFLLLLLEIERGFAILVHFADTVAQDVVVCVVSPV